MMQKCKKYALNQAKHSSERLKTIRMDIHQQLLKRHSKENTRRITEYIGSDPERYAILMQIFNGEDWVAVQRGAWVVSEVGMKYPELLIPHLDDLISAIEAPPHPAIARNGLKVIAETNIPLTEDQEGRVVQLSFELLADPKTPVAIHVYAMQCIANLLPVYPDLAIELKTLIEEGMEHGSPGYLSRGRKILKQIAKMKLQY